jgi:hypothetical protein
LFPGGCSAPPTRGNGRGSSVRMPPIVVGAGAAGHHGPGLPALMHLLRPPVQVQQTPLVYGYGNRAAGMPNVNGQAAPRWQGPPPHRAAATTSNSLGPEMMTRPPNLAAGQPAWLPSPRQQQQQQQQPSPETEEAYRNRVYARLIAEMKLQKKAEQDSAARAGQQQISQTASASAKPACFHDEGGDRPAGVEAMVRPAQFPAPHGGYPYGSSSSSNNLAQRPQRQQSTSSAALAPALAAVEKAPAAENVPSNQPVPPAPGANEGSCKGDAPTATIADNIILQILTTDC